MFRSNGNMNHGKAKVLSLCVLACLPLMTGCIVELSAITFGSVLWLDLALTPIRSILGGLALNAVNSL